MKYPLGLFLKPPASPVDIYFAPFAKKYLTTGVVFGILTLAVGVLWRCTQEAEEVPLLRV